MEFDGTLEKQRIHWQHLKDDVDERIAILVEHYGMSEPKAIVKATADVLKEYEGNGSGTQD